MAKTKRTNNNSNNIKLSNNTRKQKTRHVELDKQCKTMEHNSRVGTATTTHEPKNTTTKKNRTPRPTNKKTQKQLKLLQIITAWKQAKDYLKRHREDITYTKMPNAQQQEKGKKKTTENQENPTPRI